jgi:hypothetical protein
MAKSNVERNGVQRLLLLPMNNRGIEKVDSVVRWRPYSDTARSDAGTDCPAGGGGPQHAVDSQEVGVQPRIVSLWCIALLTTRAAV